MKPQPEDSRRFQSAIRRYGLLIKPVMARRFERIQVSNSRVSHLIERGLNQGLIHRELDPNDSRRFLLSMTAEGETLLAHVSTALHELIEQSGLNQDELAAATKVLEKLAATLTEEL